MKCDYKQLDCFIWKIIKNYVTIQFISKDFSVRSFQTIMRYMFCDKVSR
jgi:hypothetical protein